jgi:beta-galactosidase
MASHFKALDYMTWGREQDVVSNDHYLLGDDAAPEVELALSADLTRGLARQQPWLLMESSTSAVNWQARNLAKAPGQLRRNALQHLARGADGILFFQWRASRGGAEKFHSGLVPHAGTDSKVWREVVALGQELQSLAHLRGTRVQARAVLLWDYESWWAVELDSHPSCDVRFLPAVRAHYDALWRAGVTVDIAHPSADLSAYDLILVPSLYLMTDAAAAALEDRVRSGATVVVSYFSGIVDEHDHIRLGGYPGALRDLLGLRVEEFFPRPAAATVQLSGGGTGTTSTQLHTNWSAEPLETYTDGPLPGVPAITLNAFGDGTAWYVATSPDPATLERVLSEAMRGAGVAPPLDLPAGVEQVRRGDTLFVLNHTEHDVLAGSMRVAAGDVAVLPVG